MKTISLPALLMLLLWGPLAHGQRGTLVIPEREPAEIMMLRVSATSRCQQDCAVRGAPYAAERITERIQVLADGNRIVQRETEQLYRDAEGRTRVESEWLKVALVQIQDVVQNMSYRLYPETKTGLKMAMSAPVPAGPGATALNPAGVASTGAAKVAEQLAPGIATAADAEQRTERSLGTKQMEGVTVEGVLGTVTIPAGKFGNTMPIVATVESWRSPDLKLEMYVRSVDPRYGERITRIRNLRRGEPSASLFVAPTEYTVREVSRR